MSARTSRQTGTTPPWRACARNSSRLGRYRSDIAGLHIVVEAGGRTSVTCATPLLVDAHQQDIGIAVGGHRHDLLHVPAGLALVPARIPAARPEHRLARDD